MSALMFAQVALARPIEGLWTYAVPPELQAVMAPGLVVEVPLGAARETGYVISCGAEAGCDPSRVKPLSRILDATPAFTPAQLSFYEWIARYYLAPLGLVIRTATPSVLRARTVRCLVPTEAGLDALVDGSVTGDEASVVREIVARPGLTVRGLARRLTGEIDEPAVKRAAAKLVQSALAAFDVREVGGVRGQIKVVVRMEGVNTEGTRLGVRMRAVLDALAREGGEMPVAELSAAQGASVASSLKRLEGLGLVRFEEREMRDPLDNARADGPTHPPSLNEAQRHALAALTAPDAAGPWLLYGVTGSGKTEVFLGAAADRLAQGEQVLVLVPEIGLTPQLVGRFKARFGDRVAVLHSGLTASDRLAWWRKIRAGEADVVVGARSALFAPFQKLGLIVVDEEHDDSYKQDDGVRYHARDLAVVLGQRVGACVVLASATPSLETWHNAQTGRYRLLSLPERATPRPIPQITRVDRREIPKDEAGHRPLFAPQVLDALSETFEAGAQAIVLYNRRGYATLVQCADCGGSWECPNCGIAMTLHKRAGVLACHYCGLRRPMVEACPSCGSHALEELGKGTERVVDVLASAFPRVKIARMDADTTASRGSHERILQAFRAQETQMLVGTQIVAKGHDIPNVQTAVIVSADQALSLPDFRAAERTVSLIVQAAGRAGRGSQPGRVFVQTSVPEAEELLHLGDMDAFLERERERRHKLLYPPWTRLVLYLLDGTDRSVVMRAAESLTRTLRQAAREVQGVDVLGPALAAMPRLVGRWRVQVILRGRAYKPLRQVLEGTHQAARELAGRGVRLQIDVDPRHLM